MQPGQQSQQVEKIHMDAAEGFAAVFQPAVQITVVKESVFIGGKQAGQHLEKYGGQ